MKVLICPTCRREAVGPANEEFPMGAPMLMGRYTGGHFPVVVHCDRCKRSFKVDALTFNALPEITQTKAVEMKLTRMLGTPPGER